MKKILIIEDTKTYAAIIAAHIEHEIGLPFEIAGTKEEALDHLSNNRDEFCIAIVDLHLPDSPDGEIMDEIAPFKIPSIILTADISDAMREDIQSHKYVSDYVVKKVTNAFVLVIEAIRRLLRNMKTKVLVVDDSRVARRLLTHILEAQLLQVYAAENAEQALKVMHEEPQIRLVIADGELDGKSGIDMTSELRKTHGFNEVAVIGVSGVYNSNQSIAFLKAGANDFIAKPFNNEELITRVNQNLDRILDLARLKEFNESQNLLLDMVNQDISQPLGNIHNLIDLALSQFKDQPDKLVRCIETIQGSTHNMLNMLGGVQHYAKLLTKPDLNWSTFHIIDAWRGVEEQIYARAAERGINIEIDINFDPVHADRSKIAQALANLTDSALSLAKENSYLDVSSEYSGDYLWLRINYQGQTVTETDQANLFKAFGKLSSDQEYLAGLGLALSQKILELHDGLVGYESSEEGGCFWIKLPK
ncbi:hypothetical protein C2869_17640 [Saccharobesus litoralis]|uniref:Histidine kinase n=1 Tax=Saccharobesus litoralis TaxID=2172099 RepID=A0A2S0VV79_9ALTE|nr:hybrid sensor histidine kinase/response regulator [Saccharobesus litoralis]AWB68127.1 hypothetical protein C2869_17640 [Saccharobesus litoralis]